MAAPRKLPIDDLIKTSEETVALMWRAYDGHLQMPRSTPGWHQTAQVLYQRCTKFADGLKILKHIRIRTSLPLSQKPWSS
jgi:hypothetical protein